MFTRVTLVMGLGRETGVAIARHFAELGHSVLVCDPSAERIATARAALDDSVLFHHGEFHSRLGLRNSVAAAIEGFGRIDNAVIVPDLAEPDRLHDFTEERFDKVMARSVRGAALALQVVSCQLLEQSDVPQTGIELNPQKGSITFVLAYSALASMPGHFSETVAQASILSVMRAGALELADQAIRVNAIVSIRPQEERAEPWTNRRVPLGRPPLADEIAAAAGYLASPAAAIVTGETLVLDGGRATLSGLLE